MMSIQDLLSPRIDRVKLVHGRLASDRTPEQNREAREAMRRHLFGPVMPWLIPSARPTIVNGRVIF